MISCTEENGCEQKEKAPVPKGRGWNEKEKPPGFAWGLGIRMEYQKKQLLQVLGQMLLQPSASLCH